MPKKRRKPDPERYAGSLGATRQQSEKCHAGFAGRLAGLHHRRFRFGQIHTDQRYPVPRRRAASLWLQRRAGGARSNRRAGVFRQGHQRRPEPHRPHAALQSGHLHRPVHADPRTVRRRAASARTRLRPGTLLLQRQGRPLRSLPGRWRDQGRDALPARHLCALRCVPRQTLQPRNAGGAIQGQEHSRSAGHDGGAGARVLRARACRSRANCKRCSMSAWATSRWDKARPRSPAAKRSASNCRWNCPNATPAARCTSSTNRPPACISTTSTCCSRCCTGCATTATPWSSSSTIST